MFPVAPLVSLRGSTHFGPGEDMQKVSNLYSLYGLGHAIGQLSNYLGQSNVRFGDVAPGCGLLWAELTRILTGIPVPFESSARHIKAFVKMLDGLKQRYDENPNDLWKPFAGSAEHRLLIDLITQLEVQLMYELDALPIWFVTKRRAYSIDNLIDNAETVFDSSAIPLLSPRTVYDIRQAGRGLAFEVPTGAGFHAVRATEAVARGYHEIVVGLKPDGGTPLGPLINGLRTKRDALVANGAIDKEDLLHIVIEMLNRLNNVYRKPITHPDMVLDLSGALNVFDSAKCAIELMLEDAQLKYKSGPIPPAFF